MPSNSLRIDQAVALLRKARSLLFITGAGLSADSGLPTYRGVGGIYEVSDTEEGLPIEEILSGHAIQARPDMVWKYLAQLERAAAGAQFNRGHAVIAEMERMFQRVVVLTQNVDGFHRDAGSRCVIDIHGDLHDLYCTACPYSHRVSTFREISIPPKCPECQQILRPDVVLFGELLPERKLEMLEQEMALGFDLVFSVGTTSVFPYIAAPVLEARAIGRPTVEINPGTSEVSHLVDVRIVGKAAAALDTIWRRFSAGR